MPSRDLPSVTRFIRPEKHYHSELGRHNDCFMGMPAACYTNSRAISFENAANPLSRVSSCCQWHINIGLKVHIKKYCCYVHNWIDSAGEELGSKRPLRTIMFRSEVVGETTL